MSAAMELPQEWIDIGAIEDIPPLGARVVALAHADIAVFRTAGDEVYAVRDKCPHKGGPLSQGIVHGEQVTCPLHDWKTRLTDGEVVAPDTGCTHTYPVKVEDGRILLHLSINR